jgi:asparagine synthase (glutamine-hydrolysing)
VCGLAGVLRFAPGAIGDDVALALDRALTHRGPDGHGVYRSDNGRALLVHRRLAIIDPGERAAQPMATPGGRYHLAFNGEVYNYRELRAELAGRGVAFRTSSDTETLLELLALDGPAALDRVRGMFALALWDADARALLVARDRFGMKPLYVAADASAVAFASEIGALRHAGLVPRETSPAGVLAYFAWGSIPAPLTWLRGVHPLDPGTWRLWQADGRVQSGRFAETAGAYVSSAGTVTEHALRASARAAVADTVRAHLVADVPIGVFLSGGIDSAAVVSTARAAGHTDLRTYTVVVDDASYSEEPLAAATAARFATRHHTLRVEALDIRRDLDRVIRHLDQPTADAVNTFYVARAVAATGIKAVLSGIGGDEMFGGYSSFSRIPNGLALGRALGPLIRATGTAAAAVLPAWRAAKWQHFVSDPALPSAYRSQRGLFMPEEWAGLLGPALLDPGVREEADAALADAELRFFQPAGPETALASTARMETRGFLASQLLRDVDVMSMAHGLEVRMPFVDHRLQEAIWPALGTHPRLAGGKRLLVDSVPTALPAAVVDQPKRGFTLPFAAWLGGPLGGDIRDGIEALATRQWIARPAAAQVWDAWVGGQAHWSRVWALGMLGRFLEQSE